jgi:isopentenyl-diphosphate delta-isomerase
MRPTVADPAEELLQLVDELDRALGVAPRGEVHRLGLLHRAVNVVVVDSSGRVFLQQRAAAKAVSPLHWDVSASEHLAPGEPWVDAARRGLREELGVDADVLEPAREARVHLTEAVHAGRPIVDRELARLFLARHDGPFDPNPAEVADGRFFTLAEADALIASGPVTPWLVGEWPHVREALGAARRRQPLNRLPGEPVRARQPGK